MLCGVYEVHQVRMVGVHAAYESRAGDGNEVPPVA